ncbi:MAG: hypothetical protein H0W39_05755 [Sphingomonas sp.]|nr:hypothetical protein [Sphingomonas sp.]
MTLTKTIAAGAVGGLAGGLVLTTFMTIATRAGIIKTPLPVKVERWAEDRAGVEDGLTGIQEEVAAQAGHLAFSAGLGALFGAISSTFRLPPLPAGPIYGASVYALHLGVLGPAAGITKRPWNEEPETAGRRLMMHVIFGTVTALVADRIAPRLARPPST